MPASVEDGIAISRPVRPEDEKTSRQRNEISHASTLKYEVIAQRERTSRSKGKRGEIVHGETIPWENRKSIRVYSNVGGRNEAIQLIKHGCVTGKKGKTAMKWDRALGSIGTLVVRSSTNGGRLKEKKNSYSEAEAKNPLGTGLPWRLTIVESPGGSAKMGSLVREKKKSFTVVVTIIQEGGPRRGENESEGGRCEKRGAPYEGSVYPGVHLSLKV